MIRYVGGEIGPNSPQGQKSQILGGHQRELEPTRVALGKVGDPVGESRRIERHQILRQARCGTAAGLC